MRGKNFSAPGWALPLALGLASVLLMACIVPGVLTRSGSTADLTPTAVASPTVGAKAAVTPIPPTARPGSGQTVTQVTEEDLNKWLAESSTSMGEGIECRDMRGRIRPSGITVSMTVVATQLRNTPIPVEVEIKPVVREKQLEIEVADVRLGGAYAGMSAFVKPMITAGVARAYNANSFVEHQGMRVVSIELQEGYMIATSEPVGL